MADDDFQKYETEQAQKRREIDLDITNDARAGRFDTGRRTNRGMRDKHERTERQKKRDEERLAQSLKISAAYTKLYNAVMDDLDKAMPLVYDALEEANRKLAELDSKANTLPDGTRVYKNNKGEVVSEDGLILGTAEIANITWRGDEPTWEERQETKDHRDQLEAGFDRLGEIRETMEDDSIEKTSEMMEGFDKEIETIHRRAVIENNADTTFEAKEERDLDVESINFGMFKPS